MQIFLEIPTGRFLLLPSKKLYADLNLALGNSGSRKFDSGDAGSELYPGSSPERLLHETRSVARYERLGPETLESRPTTRYRVTTNPTNETGAGSETLVWIDNSLGMLIRSETVSLSGEQSSKVITELRDIKQDVDPRLFELPKDYKKVGYQQLRAEIPQTRDRRRQNPGP